MQNRTKEMSISVDVLRAAVRYDGETGETFWLERPKEHFTVRGVRHSQEHICAFWNSKHAGRNTGTTATKRGYRCIRFNGYLFMAHRVIWAIVHGTWPTGEIDHIDGDTSNNRIANLRHVDRVGNTRNSGFRSNNTSGVCGVSWVKRSGKWLAHIRRGRNERISELFPGTSDGLKRAAAWREEKMREFGYHENHGKVRA